MAVRRTLLSTLLALALACAPSARAITVYNQVGQQVIGTGTDTASGASATPTNVLTSAAYDTLVLNPPALPDPLPANAFALQLVQDAAGVNGLSIPVSGAFYGFSVEMSVVTQASEWIVLSFLFGACVFRRGALCCAVVVGVQHARGERSCEV